MSKLLTAVDEITRAVRDDPRSALELARETGVAANTIGSLRKGEFRTTTIKNLARLESLLLSSATKGASN